MKHKYLILILSLVLVGLIIGKNYSEKQYPLEVENYEYHNRGSEKARDKRVAQLVSDSKENHAKPIVFWVESIALGTQMPEGVNNAVYSSVHFGNKDIPAYVTACADEDMKLAQVNAYMMKHNVGEVRIVDELIKHFGEQYLHISYAPQSYDRSLIVDEYYWIFDSFYVAFKERNQKIETDESIIISIGSIKGLSDNYLKQIVPSGIIDTPTTFKQTVTAKRSSTPSKKYKYGDSDVYQGSSK